MGAPGEAALDDAFAAFLDELGTVDGAASSDSPPPSKKAKVTHQDADAETDAATRVKQAAALRKAAFKGDLARAERILGGLSTVERLLLIDSTDEDDGFAALHLAVIQEHLDVVRLLLQRRADVDVESTKGDTPLMWAAHQGNLAVCNELLRAGADASLKNLQGKTAAAQARAAGKRRVCEALENHAFDVAAGLKRKAAATMDAAEARRAANMAMVQAAIREQKEREQEEAFWRAVRERREGREAQEAAEKKPADDVRQEDDGDRRGSVPGAFEAAEVSAAAWDALPAKLRPQYRILGARPDSEEAEVKKLYRKLALKHHPDKNPKDPAGAKARFTEVALAYEEVCEHLVKQQQAVASKPRGACVPPPKSF